MKKRQESEPVPYSWDEETAVLIDWFRTADLPDEPFSLRRGVKVAVPKKFRASLEDDIAQGVRGARARTEALQEDLQNLFDLFGQGGDPDSP
jgi:hypothetical protein